MGMPPQPRAIAVAAATAAGDRRRVLVGVGGALVLMAVAMLVPWLTGWDVHVFSFPPLHADWDPRVGQGTVPALAVAALGVAYAGPAALTCSWPRLLLGSYGVSVAWLTSLATVDGWAGIGHILDTSYEYLDTARDVTDLSATLHEYISRIPLDSPDNWPVHIAGHPPGALLVFVALVRLGLGSGLAAGWFVLLVAATTPAAVLVTLRRLGAERLARIAAPFIVLGPAAVWMAVSADAMFGAVAAWGLCALAASATSATRGRLIAWGLVSGLLLGYGVMMSYGLPLVGLLAVAVLLAAGRWSPLVWAAGAALAVVLAFAVAGFAWWEAYPVLRQRYWDGVASNRPTSYWLWGDLAALCFSAGPLLGASVALVVARVRGLADRATSGTRPVVLLAAAAMASIVVADLSLMSKAEVERIWLPFVPWLLLGTAFLPERWRRGALALQVAMALVVQHLLFTGW